MNCYIVATVLSLQSFHALRAVPAPRNVTIRSLDFEHILRWDPGPGTPPGTVYRVNVSDGEGKSGLSRLTNVTVMNLTDVLKNSLSEYSVSVQALYEGKTSSAPFKMFTPWIDTELGPPELSLTQSEGCLQLAVRLSRGRANMPIEEIYNGGFNFKIHLNKSGAQKVDEMDMAKRNHTICALERGVEYCVQVHATVPGNKNMSPTAWKCARIGSVKQSSGVFIFLGLLAVALLLGGVVLLGLIYTGYLCKQKIHHPTVLSLPKSYFPADFVSTATPQLILEQVSVSPISTHQGKPTRTIPKPFTESSDEEDEEETQYLNRAGGPRNVSDCDETSRSSGSSALPSTANTSVENSGNSGRTVISSDQEDPLMPVPFEASGEAEDHPEIPADTVHLSPERNENTAKDCVDVNLLSVTLGALTVDEEEEEHLENVVAEPVRVHLLSDSQASLSTGAGQRSAEQSGTLLPVASCAETRDDRSVPNSAQKIFEPFLEEDSGSQEEDEDEDEEEERSGYTRR